MQKCPNCGYKLGSRLPLVLWQVSFLVVYGIWMIGDYKPREYRFIGMGAFLVFNAATIWMAIRNKPTVPDKGDDEEMRNND